jgi:hypothetical protein
VDTIGSAVGRGGIVSARKPGTPRLCRLGLIAAVATAAIVWAPPGAARAAAPPSSFFGVVPQAPLARADLSRMEGVVGTLRIPLSWAESEPQPGVYDFARFDAAVGAAAEHGIGVLPFVGSTPAWIAPVSARPPLSAAARGEWASFLRVLVRRYGPEGSFWQGRAARMPIRTWQIWNEPNFILFWRPRPSPRGYARLLATSARAIRGVDRGARIALAGVAPVGAGSPPWVFLRQLLRVPGVTRNFDLVALHPYASTVPHMTAQIEAARAAMIGAGDGRTPLLISEVGVASTGSYPSVFVRGERGQATFLRDALKLLLAKRRAWRIAGVDWFTWQDTAEANPYCSFCQGAGLIDLEGKPKQAWSLFKQIALSVR